MKRDPRVPRGSMAGCATSRLEQNKLLVGDWLGMWPSEAVLEFTAVNVDRVVDGRIVEHGGAANLLEALLECDSVRIVDPAGAESNSDGGR